MPQKTNTIGALSAGGLLFREITAVWDLLCKENYKISLEIEVKENSYIGINKEASRNRIIREIRKRFEFVDKEFIELFAASDQTGQKYLLFYLCLKTYPILMELHFDVTLPRWRATGAKTDQYFYQLKLQELNSKYPEISDWTDTTVLKTITIYKRILKEVGMLSSGKLYQPFLKNPFWCYFIKRKEVWFAEACLLNTEQRKSLIKACK